MAEWSQATFGTDAERGAIGPLKHLEKEVREAQEALDPIEIADCLLLVFDAARRLGLTLDQLMDAAEWKLEVNKMRKWNRPTSDERALERYDSRPGALCGWGQMR